MNKIEYGFSFELDKLAGVDLSHLGLEFFVPKAANEYWGSAMRTLDRSEEESGLCKVASEFNFLGDEISKLHIGFVAGISFQISVYHSGAMRGFHLPGSFVASVARYKPSIDVPIQCAF